MARYCRTTSSALSLFSLMSAWIDLMTEVFGTAATVVLRDRAVLKRDGHLRDRCRLLLILSCIARRLLTPDVQ